MQRSTMLPAPPADRRLSAAARVSAAPKAVVFAIAMGILLIMLPVALSIYAWKITYLSEQHEINEEFEKEIEASASTLRDRLNSYHHALRGAAAFLHGTQEVTQKEWHDYVTILDLKSGLPGAVGMGIVYPVAPNKADAFNASQRLRGMPDFSIHPIRNDGPHYVITLVEPMASNQKVLGLDIAFEEHRRTAANKARDSGMPAISEPVRLIQDPDQSVGFLLFYPYYKADLLPTSVAERRVTLQGWTFAPLRAENILQGLTRGQGSDYHIAVYDGPKVDAQRLLYQSGTPPEIKSLTRVQKTLPVMQREWTIVWTATPSVMDMTRFGTSIFVLLGGLCFSVVFAALVVAVSLRQAEPSAAILHRTLRNAPLTIFVVIAAGTLIIFLRLRDHEEQFIRAELQQQAAQIATALMTQVSQNSAAVERMAKRWVASGGTPLKLWREDAAQYVQQLPGLRAIEWIDAGYRLRWAEPHDENQAWIGQSMAYTPERLALFERARSHTLSYTTPLPLKQGYDAVIAYAPLHIEGRFGGFLAALFDPDRLLDTAANIACDRCKVYLIPGIADAHSPATYSFSLFDASWTVAIEPPNDYISFRRSAMPWVLLVSGLLIGLLLALVLRSMMLAKISVQEQSARKAQLGLLIQHTPAAVAMFDRELRYLAYSERWLTDLRGWAG